MKWPCIWLVLGIGLSASLAATTLERIGKVDALAYGAYLLYLFVLSLLCSVALFILLAKYRDSIWSAFLPAVFSFLPMFAGWFPVTHRISKLEDVHGYESFPPNWWLLVVMILGFFVPGYGLRLILGPPLHQEPGSK